MAWQRDTHTPDLFGLDDFDPLTAGVDEAGRGPLAGPVMAAAVILDPQRPITGLDDSKKLSPRRRERLAVQIRERALAWCVASATVEEIDRLNILQATLLAMERAVAGLSIAPERILIDGSQVPHGLRGRAQALVAGDASHGAIAAASILAKTSRDAWCLALHERHPDYGFDRHKGYGTALHLERLRQLGPLLEHRRSFAPIRTLLDPAPGAAA
jgi:ribonuclease HII